jgi:hypothetical protein
MSMLHGLEHAAWACACIVDKDLEDKCAKNGSEKTNFFYKFYFQTCVIINFATIKG